MDNTEQLKDFLITKKINLSKMCKALNREGLSNPSLYNKLSESHHIELNEGDISAIQAYLYKLKKEIEVII